MPNPDSADKAPPALNTCGERPAAVRVRPNVLSMRGYVPGEQPRGGDFIKLNTNENPYPPSPKVWPAIEHAWQQGLQRYPDPSAADFRHAASQKLGVPADWILCGNGSDEVLSIALRTIVAPGEMVAWPTPTYVLYRTLAEAHGARIHEVPFDSRWQLDAEALARVTDLRLVLLANPNSPSGTSLGPEQVLDVAARTDAVVLVDEAYVDFAEHHCLDLVRRNPRIAVSRTLSKSHSLAGLRFGFLVAQPPLVQQLMKVKDSYNCDALSIAAATAAISDGQWLRDTVERIRNTRTRMSRRLAELGFEVTDSQANFVWCRHASHDAQELYQSLQARGVLVRYMDYGAPHRGLRISVGTDQQVDRCLELLTELVT